MSIDPAQSEQEFWGNKLAPWPGRVTESLRLPASARKYLSNTGLPVGVDWHLSFVDGAERPKRIGSMVIIGRDWEIPICLDEGNEGEVVEVLDEIGHEKKHFNSSVVFFGAFLKLYQWYRLNVRSSSQENPDDELIARRLIDNVEQRMRAIEAGAFQNADYAWPEIIEQMRDGFL